MERYEEVDMEVILFDERDIVSASDPDPETEEVED